MAMSTSTQEKTIDELDMIVLVICLFVLESQTRPVGKAATIHENNFAIPRSIWYMLSCFLLLPCQHYSNLISLSLICDSALKTRPSPLRNSARAIHMEPYRWSERLLSRLEDVALLLPRWSSLTIDLKIYTNNTNCIVSVEQKKKDIMDQ